MITITASDKLSRMCFAPELGGIGTSLQFPINGCLIEHLFLQENAIINPEAPDLIGGWPLLFPVCGRVARDCEIGVYSYQQQRYHLPIHGIAPYLPWTIEDHQSDRITLSLNANAETRKNYPFEFRVRLSYHIEPGRIKCEQTYANLGLEYMPYYAGFHPYFYTPEKSKTTLSYAALHAYQYNDTLSDVIARTPAPSLPSLLTNPALNEKLTRVAAETVLKLAYPTHALFFQITSIDDPDMFPYVQLYTDPEKPFFCIEPWMACPNALNTMSGTRWLAPGQEERAELNLWVENQLVLS